ncbi:hypothetical protein ACIP79_05545 [Streptomyces sp. NPDC088747]|uniref:hypothetical protein n=1 Tax=Streptomyces sp. NPDC088747 TaxID=3365886 RepID=UPI00383042D4
MSRALASGASAADRSWSYALGKQRDPQGPPKLPGGDMTWPPVLILTTITLALTGAGLGALRRRDLSA